MHDPVLYEFPDLELLNPSVAVTSSAFIVVQSFQEMM